MEVIVKNVVSENRFSSGSGGFNARVASTDAELEQIYRLRYRIRVEEMNKKEPYANHADKAIIEPLDNTGINIGIWDQNELIACARMNFGHNSDIDYYVKHYRMEQIKNFIQEKVCIGTKLMVDRNYRNTRLNVLLMQASARCFLENGAEFCVIESRDELLKYYGRFGFRPYAGKFYSEVYGEITPIVLHLSDIDHLIAVKSPLLITYYDVKSSGARHFDTAA